MRGPGAGGTLPRGPLPAVRFKLRGASWCATHDLFTCFVCREVAEGGCAGGGVEPVVWCAGWLLVARRLAEEGRVWGEYTVARECLGHGLVGL